MSKIEKNIVLIGFMGAGKTTVGKELSRLLDLRFVDLDQAIEEEANQNIQSIFKTEGEAGFRKRERALFHKLSKQTNMIFSLGGGAFLQEEIQHACLQDSLVIFLDIDFSIWAERIPLLQKDRPLLQEKSLEDMKELYTSRKQSYSKAHLIIQTGRLTPPQTAEKIAKTIHHAEA